MQLSLCHMNDLRTIPALVASRPGFEQGVEFLAEALEFGEGASSAKFRDPNGQVYELWRPEERYRMGSQ